MKKDYLAQPVELVLKEPAAICPRGKHSVSFFELVYIVSGTGTQTINGSNFKYKQGNLFLLAPEDAHCFTFLTKTQLFFIRFNKVFFHSNTLSSAFWRRLEQTLENASRLPGSILKNREEHAFIGHLMHCLLAEFRNKNIYSQELMQLLIQSIMTVVGRNLLQQIPLPINEKTEDKAAGIIQFVHQHIYEPEKLKTAHLSRVFGAAETYIGRYFKNETGKTLSEYIAQYKLQLIENRLKHSNMRIHEIAGEFGFTDKSHLNRFFQKGKGVTPSAYRKASS
ncbi:helix-turn-helix domain-containing protein [Niastella vici]|nr:AraC family transcriptional regulator [Niastella vici]